MTFANLDGDAILNEQDSLRDEVQYARNPKNGSTYVPLGLVGVDALGQLLGELAEVAMDAPGGHGHLIDEARRWSDVLLTQAREG